MSEPFGAIFHIEMSQKWKSASPYVWRKANTAFNLISTVKHGGVSVRVCGCFVDYGPWRLINIEGMNSGMYQKILKENIQPSKELLDDAAGQ